MNNLPDSTAILALLLTPGVGEALARRAIALARQVGKPLGALIGMSAHKLIESGAMADPGAMDAVLCCGNAEVDRARDLIGRVQRAGAIVLTQDDPRYPETLSSTLDNSAPPLLFVLGDPTLLSKRAGAVVGARVASLMAIGLARACAKTLVEAGACVVSGGAQGVDTAAHDAALAAGGSTVVVLPQGLLTYLTPPGMRHALEGGLAVAVSQFAPDMPWETYAAVSRNATIAALARLVVVVDPKRVGGSIRTARCAMHRGKHVLFWCDGNSMLSADLMRAGARPLLDPDGEVDRAHLLRLWSAAQTPPMEQATLFQ